MKKYLMCGLFSHLINLKPKKKKCHFHHFYCSKTTEQTSILTFTIHYFHHTVIPSWIYQIPSEL